MDVIGNDENAFATIEGGAEKRGSGYAQNLRLSIYNPDQAEFIIKYYTEKNYLILDPFMGRATRPLISLHLDRKYVGIDTCSQTIAANTKLIKEKFPSKPENEYLLIHGDGTVIPESFDDAYADCVFTCPPYYRLEKYSGESGDLSYATDEEFNFKMQNCFNQLYRIIKTSSYKERKFYPVIFTVGTIRRGNSGLIDMDYIFQTFAKNAGFVLHDKLFSENSTPGAGFTFRRNYLYKFLTKNYELTLVFMKYNEGDDGTE